MRIKIRINRVLAMMLAIIMVVGVVQGAVPFNTGVYAEDIVEDNPEGTAEDNQEDQTEPTEEPVEEPIDEPVEGEDKSDEPVEEPTEEPTEDNQEEEEEEPTEGNQEEESTEEPVEEEEQEEPEELVETVVVIGSNIDELVFTIITDGYEGLESKEHTIIIEEIVGQVVIEAKESVEDAEGNIYNFVEWQGVEETGRILTFGNDSVVEGGDIIAIYELEVVEEELSEVDVVKEKYDTEEVVEVAGGVIIAKVSGENVDGDLTKLTARDYKIYKNDIANFEVNLDTPVGVFNSVKVMTNKVIFNTNILTEEWYRVIK